MNQLIAIHELSSHLGLTSRTLRHWESEGLFQSIREGTTSRRLYDEDAVLCIHITMLLRKLDLPLKEIKSILKQRSFDRVKDTVLKQLLLLEQQQTEIMVRRRMLMAFLETITKNMEENLELNSLEFLGEFMESPFEAPTKIVETEDNARINHTLNANEVRLITLPSMRMAYHVAVSASPEEEAMAPVMEWLKSSNLLGTARIFGGNVEPMPSSDRPEYGYGVYASIPEHVEIPLYLTEMRFPGGLYAMAVSSEDIYGSWQSLMKALEERDDVIPDHQSRLYLEEHIRNGNPDGEGNLYHLHLLEPVKKR